MMLLFALALQAAGGFAPMPPPPSFPVRPSPVVVVPLDGKRTIAVAFVVIDGRGFLRESIDGTFVGIEELSGSGFVLSLLADRAFAAMWPMIIAWAGSDLVRMRDANVARARATFEAELPADPATNMLQSTVRPRVRAALQFSEVLRDAGRRDEATLLLERERDAVDRSVDWGRAEWATLTVRIANMQAFVGDFVGADAILAAASDGLPPASPYAANFHINRAAHLAEHGDYAKALAALDTAIALFDGGNSGGSRVKGSDRQFGWIRACALAGLGRPEEARRALAPVLSEKNVRQGGFVLTPGAAIRWRARACMKDSGAAAADLVREMAIPAPTYAAFLLLQPGYIASKLDPAFIARVRADPVLTPLLAARMRVLPPELLPALNNWRAPPP